MYPTENAISNPKITNNATNNATFLCLSILTVMLTVTILAVDIIPAIICILLLRYIYPFPTFLKESTVYFELKKRFYIQCFYLVGLKTQFYCIFF